MNRVFLYLFAIISLTNAQAYYVPAQILIPTINGTHIIASNGTIYNITAIGGYQPTKNNNTQNAPPPAAGWAVGNPTFQQTNRNWTNNNNSSLVPNKTTTHNETQEGHLFAGNIQLYDRLIFSQEYFKDSRWWTSREKIIEYPKDLPAGYTRHEIISAIRIYNKFYDGNSARAYILKGGVGSQYVKIKLESKWNHGFRYLVQIFGH